MGWFSIAHKKLSFKTQNVTWLLKPEAASQTMDGFTYLQETVKLILICKYFFHVEISLLSHIKAHSQLK